MAICWRRFLNSVKQSIDPDRFRDKGRIIHNRHQIQRFLIRSLDAIQCALTVVLARNGCLQLLQFLKKFPVVQMLQILGVDDANNVIQRILDRPEYECVADPVKNQLMRCV